MLFVDWSTLLACAKVNLGLLTTVTFLITVMVESVVRDNGTVNEQATGANAVNTVHTADDKTNACLMDNHVTFLLQSTVTGYLLPILLNSSL